MFSPAHVCKNLYSYKIHWLLALMASKKAARIEQLAQARAQRSNAAPVSSTSILPSHDIKISKKEANKEQLAEARANKETLAETRAKELNMALSLENLQSLLSDSDQRLQHADELPYLRPLLITFFEKHGSALHLNLNQEA